MAFSLAGSTVAAIEIRGVRRIDRNVRIFMASRHCTGFGAWCVRKRSLTVSVLERPFFQNRDREVAIHEGSVCY